jgi:hypothetical protein
MNTHEIYEVLLCPMKAYMGFEGEAPVILTLEIDRRDQLHALVILPS